MKKKDIEKLTDSIDNKYIEEAANFNNPAERTKFRKPWIIAAACLLAASITIPTALYAFAPNEPESFTEESHTEESHTEESDTGESHTEEKDNEEISYPDIITDDINHTNIKLYAERNNGSIFINEEAYRYSWLEQTDSELYDKLIYNGKTYLSKTYYSWIEEADIGRSLGVHTLSGTDGIDDTVHYAEFEIFEINGVPSEYCVAAAMDDVYYPFHADVPKETLGEMVHALKMYQNMPLVRFGVNIKGNETTYSKINDEKRIWEILLQCTDAKYNKEMSEVMFWQSDHEYVSFSATSRKLGLNGKIRVTTDGYVWTTLFGYARVYDIGIEKANEIIDYALNNSVPTSRVRDRYWICGHIAEINDDYILIDDSDLCKNKEEGTTYKLKANDKRIIRGIKYNNFKVGDLAVVVVNAYGYVDEYNGNTVYGIIDFERGHIQDDDIIVLE